jgi:hypothetical protein
MGITMSSKAIALDLILEKQGIKLNDQDRLDTDSIESFDHIPPIPKYIINREDYDVIASGITTDLLPRRLIGPNEPIGIIPIMYPYMNSNWIPVGIEGGSICCNAVLPETTLKLSTDRTGLTHAPKIGNYRNVIYYLTDELILFSVK